MPLVDAIIAAHLGGQASYLDVLRFTARSGGIGWSRYAHSYVRVRVAAVDGHLTRRWRPAPEGCSRDQTLRSSRSPSECTPDEAPGVCAELGCMARLASRLFRILPQAVRRST